MPLKAQAARAATNSIVVRLAVEDLISSHNHQATNL